MRTLAAAFILVLAGCVTAPAPIDDYTLARAALEAARSVEAARHSPGFYHQAEESYRKAKLLFEEREYERAKEQFVRARIAAEKAENSARLIRMKSGEVL
ncbi:MAG: DUF4398 domain-containing protein [Bdellovibrionaceae bacterium]|nr:DUF4398 domain-containing protein [Pseudobdellovibrionaceae bacterium]